MKIPSLILGCVIIALIGYAVFAYLTLEKSNTNLSEVLSIPTQSPVTENTSAQSKPSQETSQVNGSVKALLKCENQDIQSEVVFVTTANQPLQLHCLIEDSIVVPAGYRKELPQFEWYVSSGTLEGNGAKRQWHNPKPGLQTVIVSGYINLAPTGSSSNKTIPVAFESGLKLIVPVYIENISSGMVNGFEVGKYPNPSDPADLALSESAETVKRHADVYQPPKLFYEVNPDTYNIKIYRDYALGEFDLDPRFSPLEYPRYIALSPDILTKMGMLEDSMRSQGVQISKFKIIYGFRSPSYNLGAISTDEDKTLKSPFSMHMYGKAVDFIVDENDDFRIDDLNQDGDISLEDAKTFREYIRKIDTKLMADKSRLVGAGIIYYHHDYYERGEYVQSPYVHMDTRGYVREDGSLIYLDVSQKIQLDPTQPYRIKKPIPKSPFQKMFERLKLY